MSIAPSPTRVPSFERRKRERMVESWYPYVPKEMPSEVSADSFFVTNPTVVKLVEEHLIPAMPAALFFTGTYRRDPQGKGAFERVLRDFDRVLEEIGHQGQYFAVAHTNYSCDDERTTRLHLHAIVDYSEALPLLGKRWADAHGSWKAGRADVGAFYYVARHACDGKSSMRDRLYDIRASA